MRDQAESLRRLVQSKTKNGMQSPADATRVLTITSGKGGVGKTNIAVNLAFALQNMGYRVLVIDADFGLGNVDIMLGISPRYNLSHVIFDKVDISDVIIKDPSGIMILPGGSGLLKLANISSLELDKLIEEIGKIERLVDIVIIDTGAGLSSNNIKMILAASEAILVTTTDPTSLMDAYGMIKVVSSMNNKVKFNLIMNMVDDIKHANIAIENLQRAGKHFLNVDISKLGIIETSSAVTKSIRVQSPFIVQYPHSKAARQLKGLASSLTKTCNTRDDMSIKSYINRLFALFRKK